MLGAVAGDIIGSVYEHRRCATRLFPLFHTSSTWTDDTVLALAVAEAILSGRPYGEVIREFARRYPDAGYGGSFIRWFAADNAPPYHSWGNGSAMRAPAVGYAFSSEEEVLAEAAASACPTHDHPEGIRGAQAVALAVFLARGEAGKEAIRARIEDRLAYDLSRTVASIQPTYGFDVSCQGSVPEAIICFLDSRSWEDAVRNAVWLGGDSDTIACIAGAIAEAWYGGVPQAVRLRTREALPPDLRDVLERFTRRFVPRRIDRSTGSVEGPLEAPRIHR